MDLLEFNLNTFNREVKINPEFKSPLFNKICGKSIQVLQPEIIAGSEIENVSSDYKLECIENDRRSPYVLLDAEKGCHDINKKLIGHIASP